MARRWVPPAFCKGFDCPMYEVLDRTADYELRRYPPSRWVTCETRARSYQEAARVLQGGGMFNSLFQYISGYNAAGQKIDMTVPVLMRIAPQPDSSASMSFYVPPDVAAPQPADRSVRLMQLPDITVYVRSFGGFMEHDDAERQASILANSIGDRSKFDSSHYYSAAYDAPFRANNRHNEVWLVKT